MKGVVADPFPSRCRDRDLCAEDVEIIKDVRRLAAMHGSERPEAIWALDPAIHPLPLVISMQLFLRKESGEGKTSRFLISSSPSFSSCLVDKSNDYGIIRAISK